MIRFNSTGRLSFSLLAMLVVATTVAICDWHRLPSIEDAQPLAAVTPKDTPAPAGPPPPPAQPAPPPVKPAAAPVQAAKPAPPVKPILPDKPALPVKPLPAGKPTDPTVVKIKPSGTTTTTRPKLKDGQTPSDTTLTVRTDEAGHVVSMEVSTAENAVAAELKPYNQGGGHHTPAKRAFEGAPNYDANKALAIPNAELERLKIKHIKEITPAQRNGYIEFAKSGKKLTWEAVANIETEALIKAEMSPVMAKATVAKAIQALKDTGVPGPMRIPWGK